MQDCLDPWPHLSILRYFGVEGRPAEIKIFVCPKTKCIKISGTGGNEVLIVVSFCSGGQCLQSLP